MCSRLKEDEERAGHTSYLAWEQIFSIVLDYKKQGKLKFQFRLCLCCVMLYCWQKYQPPKNILKANTVIFSAECFSIKSTMKPTKHNKMALEGLNRPDFKS